MSGDFNRGMMRGMDLPLPPDTPTRETPLQETMCEACDERPATEHVDFDDGSDIDLCEECLVADPAVVAFGPVSGAAAPRLQEGAQPEPPQRDYLVWLSSDRLWWKSDSKGYSAQIVNAGRYTKEEAERIQASSGSDRGDIAVRYDSERMWELAIAADMDRADSTREIRRLRSALSASEARRQELERERDAWREAFDKELDLSGRRWGDIVELSAELASLRSQLSSMREVVELVRAEHTGGSAKGHCPICDALSTLPPTTEGLAASQTEEPTNG
jgi:hypothetical protein